MDPDEEGYDMLDILAYNCGELSEKLANENNADEKNNILNDYIRKADTEHQSINDFKEDLDWFNVTEPLSTKDSLQGKIVILDFFTYCCINCMHILPDLKKLEQIYHVEDGVVVIGVHSAKFDNEKDSANILSAVQRYDITHPVVNDSSSSMWINLKIKCWPTLLILGPRANPLFVLMGEGHYETLVSYVTATVKYYKSKNLLKMHSLPLNPATELLMSSNLKFPGKIVCHTMIGENLDLPELFAISDSGNHRILIIKPDGEKVYTIGGKDSGFIDGNFQKARFNTPQGLTFLNNNILFVADTENHAIRKIDLEMKTVETVAGTGVQGNDRIGGKIGHDQELSSPWDVAAYRTRDMDMSFHVDEQTIEEKDIILIAAAGTHQIWALFLNDVIWWKFKKFLAGTVASIAGNGHEENRNNSYPYNASFAQPSGFAIDKENKDLYIADSESSCVRKLSLADGKVLPVVGGDRNPLNLFAFGDVDGKQYVAKLQHPLGVAYNSKNNFVYVADTYNHKIKQINSVGCNSTTCNITDKTGNPIQFNEPGGLCVNTTGELLYVADTNNHSIEVVNLETMVATPLKLYDASTNQNFDQLELGKILKYSPIMVKPQGGNIQLTIEIRMTELGLTKDAPQTWQLKLPNDNWIVKQSNGVLSEDQKITLDVTVPGIENSQPEEHFTVSIKLILCSSEICFPKTFSILFPVVYSNEGLNIINKDVLTLITKENVELL